MRLFGQSSFGFIRKLENTKEVNGEMATVELVETYKRLANRPHTTRHLDYVIERIEKELVKRARKALRMFGLS